MASEQPTKEAVSKTVPTAKPLAPPAKAAAPAVKTAAPIAPPAKPAAATAKPATVKPAVTTAKPAAAATNGTAVPPAVKPAAAKAPAANGAKPPAANGAKAPPPPAGAKAAVSKTLPIAVPEEEEEEEGGFMHAIHGLYRNTPSWLTSMILHVVILLVLGSLSMPKDNNDKFDDLIVDSLEPGDSVDELNNDSELDTVKFEDAPMMSDIVPTNTTAVSSVDVAEDPTPTLSSATELSDVGDVGAMMESMMSSAGNSTKGDLSQRGSAQARMAAVAQGGGSAGSEEAVALALAWLAAHQQADGGWSFDHRPGKCNGRCDHTGTMKEARFAATGFGLLPFLGAGQTHKQGKYKENVKAGLAYLIQNMKGGSMYESGGSLYSHGIGAIALCESYAMTQDKNLLAPAQAAIKFTCEAQDPVLGGWQYAPKNGSDTSGMGWQLMALKSGHMGYLAIPDQTIKNAVKFLNSVQADGGATYGYNTPGAGQATTAIGLLSRMYLGWKKDNPALKKGVETLSAWGPSIAPGNGSMYYNYYATQVMHHWEGEHWVRWNEKMRDGLIAAQSKDGHAKGSWYLAGDHGSDLGGRLYNTALCTMTLEVYYRHLPLYKNNSTDDDFEE